MIMAHQDRHFQFSDGFIGRFWAWPTNATASGKRIIAADTGCELVTGYEKGGRGERWREERPA